MCTANVKDTDAFSSFGNFKEYARSKDGQAEIATLGGGINDSINSYFDAKQSNAYADYQQSVLLANASAYKRSALDIIEAGRDKTAWLGFQGRAEQATVKNNQAYRGIDTNVGTAVSSRKGLEMVNKINIDNTRYNALLQSFGMENKALEMKHKAQATQLNKKSEWAGVLVSLGKSALSIYSMGAGGAGTGAK